ncbi:MAG: hypothetical protein IT436_03205 [Phycisphaerales bacterium]|nr:hypothetical protein [Phycisphaerales bacterium]
MSDEVVQRATGRDWAAWFSLLDARGAASMAHAAIARLTASQGAAPWWSQMVAVAYERARGLRDVHQKSDGYSASCSRTIAVSAGKAYSAWKEARKRSAWLPGPVAIRTASPGKRLRFNWPVDGRDTSVEVHFWPKGPDRVQIAIQHGKLAGRDEFNRMKAFWGERLDVLRDRLERAAR